MIDENSSNNKVGIATGADKFVPKFCTGMNIALLNNKNLVLTMLYGEGEGATAIIERIAIDIAHAQILAETLDKILKEADNG